MADLDHVLVAELERIAPAEPAPQPRWSELRPRRRSPRIAATAVAAVAAAIIALAVPWHRGPAALSPADAARIVQRATAALAPSGRVLHLRLHVTVASRAHPKNVAWSGDTDMWIDESGAQNYRLRTTFPNLPSPVQTGGAYRGTSPTYVYDAADRTLYYVPLYGSGSGFVDPIAQAKHDLQRRAGVTVRRVGDTYRIEDDRNLRRTTVLIIDARTYRPIQEIATIGAGAPFALYSQKPHAPLSALWQTTTEYRTYEYVDDAALASIRAQLPHAKVGVSPDMPKAFRQQFEPWTG